MSPSAAWTSTDFSQGAGIHITGTGATGDWIYGDFLGTDPTGTQAGPNDEGVEIDGGATTDVIGTNGDSDADAGERDVIGGNTFAGVWIHGVGTTGNVVAGDLIGTNVTGDAALPNARRPYGASGFYDNVGGGVIIDGGATGNRIGGDSLGPDGPGPTLRRRQPHLGQRERRRRAFRHRDERATWSQGDLIGTDLTGDQRSGQRAARSPDRLRGLE